MTDTVEPTPAAADPAPVIPPAADGGSEGFFESIIDEAGTIGKWIWSELVAAEEWVVDEITGASKQGQTGQIKVTAPDGTVDYHPKEVAVVVHPEIAAALAKPVEAPAAPQA